jgi:hypothetical protein
VSGTSKPWKDPLAEQAVGGEISIQLYSKRQNVRNLALLTDAGRMIPISDLIRNFFGSIEGLIISPCSCMAFIGHLPRT